MISNGKIVNKPININKTLHPNISLKKVPIGTPSTSELLRPIKIMPIARPLRSFSTSRVATAMATTVAIPPLTP
ncbi:hypothetical protein D3C79_955930 [compost metagenome]